MIFVAVLYYCVFRSKEKFELVILYIENLALISGRYPKQSKYIYANFNIIKAIRGKNSIEREVLTS